RSERTSLSNCANAARTPSISLPVDVSSMGSVADRNEMTSLPTPKFTTPDKYRAVNRLGDLPKAGDWRCAASAVGLAAICWSTDYSLGGLGFSVRPSPHIHDDMSTANAAPGA